MIQFFSSLSTATETTQPRGKAKVVFVSGQSNAQNRSDAANLAIQYQGEIDNVFTYALPGGDQTEGYQGTLLGQFNWQKVHAGTNSKNVYLDIADEGGLMAVLGSMLTAYYNEPIYFVKYCRGSTAISAWDNTSGNMWLEMNDFANDAFAEIGREWEPLFFVWDQGENDRLTPLYEVYDTNALDLFSRIRSTWGSMDIFFRKLSTAQTAMGLTNILNMHTKQDIIYNANPSNSIYHSEDMVFFDNVHLDAPSHTTLCTRIFELHKSYVENILPQAVGNLQSSLVTGGVLLSWDTSIGATEWAIERSTDDIVFTEIGTSTHNDYTDLITSGTYYYRVKGRSKIGDGQETNSVSVIVP